MNRKNSIKTKRTFFLMTLLLLLTAPIILSTFTLNYMGMTETQESIKDPTSDPISMSQEIGEDVWWNKSFRWRQCINITNPGTFNLVDNIIKITFNWNDLYTTGHIQQDLDDIRIVENGELREYYIKKNYPSTNLATVWFETNSTGGSSDYDTYMYYGNDTVNRATSYYMENCPEGIARWTFDDDPTGTVVDTASYLYNGTLAGGMDQSSYIQGKYGNGIEIDMDDSNAQRIPLNMCLYTGTQTPPSGYEANSIKGPFYEFTISAWVKLDLDEGGWSIIDFDRSEFFNMPAGSPGYTANAGEVEFGTTSDSGSTQDMKGVQRVDGGDWTHIMVRFDASETNEKKIYVNGSLDAASNQYSLNTPLGDSNELRFGFLGIGSEATSFDGSNNGYTAYRDGIMRLDDVRFFDYSLTQKEIEWTANYYDLDLELLGEVERSATVSFIIKDYDGLRVENAEVALWNRTEILNVTDYGEFKDYTDSQGEVEFSGVPFGEYNVTVNYTLSSGAGIFEEIVYDSRTIQSGEVSFQGLFVTEVIYTNLWTIDFEVDDYDGDPLDYGYINISAEGNTQVLEQLELDSDGKTRFVWLSDKTSYNYSVYYYNTDYYKSSTLLNSSTIYRNLKNENYQLNQTATGSYSLKRSIFIPGSSLGYSGINRVVEARLSCRKMEDNLTSIFMNYYYSSETEPTTVNSTLYNNGETSDDLTYYPYETSDDIYGIQFEINGQNNTISNGTVSLNLTYTYSQYIQTNISTLSVRIMDQTGTEPVSGIKVRVKQNGTAQQVVELTTDPTGYAYGSFTNDFGFRYLTDWTYNFTLWVVTEQQTFTVNTTDQAKPPGITDYYNYTLFGDSNLVFNLDLDYTERIANFTNKMGPSSVTWGENMTFSAIYQTSYNGGDTWRTDYNRNGSLTSATWTIYTQFGEKILERSMKRVDEISSNTGNFTIEVNSSLFSAGGSGKYYYAYISGHKNFWRDPNPAFFGITIEPIDTDLELYNYTTLEKLTTNQISASYGDTVNMTLRYSTTENNINLTAETITYEWDYGGPTTINKDPLNPNFYTFSLNLSTIPNIGTYRIDINAQRENYSSVSDYAIYLNVLERETILNGSGGLLPISKNYKALETHYIYFEYNDTIEGRLSDIYEKSYTWYQLAEDGSIISGPFSGELNTTMNNLYFLDFDTETRAVGKYQIFITLDKNNYEERNAIVNLEIENRPTTSTLSETVDDIDLGEAKNYSISYIDDLTTNVIEDPDLKNYTYTGPETGSGVLIYDPVAQNYTLDINTASLSNGTYTIDITLDKENYQRQDKTLILTISRVLTNYTTRFTSVSTVPSGTPISVEWGENIQIDFTFQNSSNKGQTWEETTPDTLTLRFYDLSDTQIGDPINLLGYSTGLGTYSYTFNTSQHGFIGGNTYRLKISASLALYNPPDPIEKNFQVNTIPTNLFIYNYTTDTEFPSDQTTVYWDQDFNITLYYETTDGDPLTDATIMFDWSYGTGQVSADTFKGDGYYTFLFDSGNATNIGSYLIDFSASKQNYSSQTPSLNLIIINRPTTINGTDGLLAIDKDYYALDTHYIYFEYNDTETGRLSSLNKKTYVWYRLDEDGSPLSGPGNQGEGELNTTGNNLYFLDFDTELRAVGKYQIFVTLDKNNYETRNSLITIEIENRPTTSTLSTSSPDNIPLGEAKNYTITYVDTESGSVITDLDNYNWSYTGPENGTGNLIYDAVAQNYTLDIETAGLTNGTYTIDITLNKVNYEAQSLTFTLIVNRIQGNYTTRFTSVSTDPSATPISVIWGEEISIDFIFQNSSDEGATWENTTPSSLTLRFYNLADTQICAPINLLGYSIGTGIYSFSFNTSQYSFIGGNSYYFEISASLPDYNPPDNIRKSFTVETVPTNLYIYNYTTDTEFPSDQTTVYWNQEFNFTLYYETVSSAKPLVGASVSYSWAYGSGIINPDSMKGSGYYTFLFNSGNATNVGTYTVEFTATLQNYTTKTPSLTVIIEDRPTRLNQSSGVYVINSQMYVKEAKNFSFIYTDFLSGSAIDSADEFDFTLQKLDSQDNVIETRDGKLIEGSGNNYILDLNTEKLTHGNYRIFVNLDKDNYEGRSSIMFLTINKRVFGYTAISTSIKIESGGSLSLSLTLTDPNNNSEYVEDADVYIILGSQRYNFTELGNGTYSLFINKISDPFFVPDVYTPTLFITKGNFTTVDINMRVEVKMAEIFPGFPTFYFSIIVGAVVAVAGSVGTYRYIQIARIPEFVKRARSMKKEIRNEKSISDKNLYPSKEEFIAEMYGEDWEELGLSLEEKLGIQPKKGKKLNKSEEGGAQ